MTLPDVAKEWNALDQLNDRHLVIEAHLIIEEHLDALLKKLVPYIEKNLLRGICSLNYEQKIQLAQCFLEREDFLTFPKMVQRMRNKIAHNRSYDVSEEKLKEFFDKLAQEDRETVLNASKNIASKLEKDFSELNARVQFLLLVIWFTIGVKVEIQRITSGPHYEIL